jgi:hypothetical protein
MDFKWRVTWIKEESGHGFKSHKRSKSRMNYNFHVIQNGCSLETVHLAGFDISNSQPTINRHQVKA